MSQKEYIFFPKNQEPPSVEYLRNKLDPSNLTSPYYGFIGNTNAINKLIRLDISSLRKFNHCANDLNLAFIGKSGCGKTELVKCHAKANQLPLVEIHPKAVKKSHDIFLSIAKICEAKNIPLYSEDNENFYVCPPINVFIDEVHALSNNLVQSLLKATEPKDRQLITEEGYYLDCSLIHWIIATTDRGKLFDAFDTRFSKINVNMYTKKEISEIIHINYPHWPKMACDLVSHFCSKIPREALAFAKEMELEYNINSVKDWNKIANIIAKDNNIDEFGMNFNRLKVLQLLKQGPISSKTLPVLIGVKQEELENFIIPFLMEQTEDQDSLITICSKGYALTNAGIIEIKKRI